MDGPEPFNEFRFKAEPAFFSVRSLNDSDDEGIEAWVIGVGRICDDAHPVGDIVSKACEDFSIRDNLFDPFIQALLSQYSVDVDEGVDWDQVPGAIKELM
jgi:hypothetical protein